ncbi:MAG: hypothetical protein Q4P24_18130 [Rhodobacterales bacterium]|nr:hypothetical protein [Rhodobacterales bacterium]
MVDIVPSPTMSRYAFDIADDIYIDGRQYQYFETRGNEHLFAPADGKGIIQAFNNSQIAGGLDKGKFEHKPAKKMAQDGVVPAQFLSLFSAKEKERAETREALVLAFQELHAKKKVKRTDSSITDEMGTICLRAADILENLHRPNCFRELKCPRRLGRDPSVVG